MTGDALADVGLGRRTPCLVGTFHTVPSHVTRAAMMGPPRRKAGAVPGRQACWTAASAGAPIMAALFAAWWRTSMGRSTTMASTAAIKSMIATV